MRIALHIDCPPWEPTGIGRYMFELARALKHRGNHLEGWARWRWFKKASSSFRGMGVRVLPLMSAKGINDPLLSTIYAGADRIDVVHSPNGQLLPSTGKVPQTVMVHDLAIYMYPELKPAEEIADWKRKIARSVAGARAILVNSATTAEDLREFFPEASDRIYLTRLGIDHFRNPLKNPGSRGEHILAVGTVDPRKNYEALFNAYSEAASELPDIPPLIIAGGMGYRSAEIRSAAENSPFSGKIRFEGYVSEHRLKELYQSACCLVHTAIYEGFGFTVPEALGFGIPVVCSNNSALRELFSGAAYLVDSGNSESISHGLRQALEKGISESQKEAVDLLFSTLTWDNCASSTEKAFSDIT